jgi:redox-sensitive bicupin YhaK (pirin superfamily)
MIDQSTIAINIKDTTMIRVHKSGDRGHFDHGWLDTYHTFSFAGYYDPRYMGFRALRVINEDRVAPGRGFGAHSHRDMEIVTYVLAGELAHRDSLGTEGVVRPGELQRMTAGTGITHSEYNASKSEPVHLYQIWLLPEKDGLEPSYEQRAFPDTERHNVLRLVAAPGGEGGALAIRQDARLYLASMDPGAIVTHELSSKRHAWLQVLRGEITLGSDDLGAGDAAALSGEAGLDVRAKTPSEVLLFDLA